MNTTLWDWIVVLLGLCIPALLFTVVLHFHERAARKRMWRKYGVVPRPLPYERRERAVK